MMAAVNAVGAKCCTVVDGKVELTLNTERTINEVEKINENFSNANGKSEIKETEFMNKITNIIVAPFDADSSKKDAADFVCGEKNNEITIGNAIEACVEQNKNLLLLNGIYRIDAFYDFGDSGST